MSKQERIITLLFSLASIVAGVVLLWTVDWRVGLGALLLVTGNNASEKVRQWHDRQVSIYSVASPEETVVAALDALRRRTRP